MHNNCIMFPNLMYDVVCQRSILINEITPTLKSPGGLETLFLNVAIVQQSHCGHCYLKYFVYVSHL